MRGYDRRRLGHDVAAGLVVGVVAIPLSIAFAIASGLDPRAGLVTAVVAGVLVGLVGGSRLQVSGPTGAFVVIVAGVVATHGVGGLLVATFLAGAMLVALGLARMGKVIQFIPYPLIVGFTAGIGAIILLGQLPDVLGVARSPLDASALERSSELARQVGDVRAWSLGLAAATVGTILVFKRWMPRVPGPVVALVALTAASHLLALPVETVGERFGEIPRSLPTPTLPSFDLGLVRDVFPSALALALLGAMESLLSAVVADGMTGDRHDPDQELVAQGLANLATPLVGGMPATGALARTATNIRSGASSPIATLVHALTIAVFILVLGSSVQAIPMAVLSGILVMTAINMLDLRQLREAARLPRADALVLVTTFLLTVFVDLVVAVEVGLVLAALLFMGRMARAGSVVVVDPTSDPHYAHQQSLEGKEVPDGVVVYSVDGPFFFGAAHEFERALERVAGVPQVVVLRMRHVPYMDGTGLAALRSVTGGLRAKGTAVVLSAVQSQPFEVLQRSGFLVDFGDENVQPTIDAALARARALLDAGPPAVEAAPGPRAGTGTS